jgi:hypothetical protein
MNKKVDGGNKQRKKEKNSENLEKYKEMENKILWG